MYCSFNVYDNIQLWQIYNRARIYSPIRSFQNMQCSVCVDIYVAQMTWSYSVSILTYCTPALEQYCIWCIANLQLHCLYIDNTLLICGYSVCTCLYYTLHNWSRATLSVYVYIAQVVWSYDVCIWIYYTTDTWLHFL